MKNRSMRLLLVDDEADLCLVFKSYFEKRGFEVLTTDNGASALDIIKGASLDVVILDITIGSENGVDILKELRRNDSGTKVIVMTGQRYSEEEIERITGLGISGYYEKPVLLEQVEKLVLELVGKTTGCGANRADLGRNNDVSGKMVHDTLNLAGIIMNQCENFSLGVDDGIYKSSDEVLERFSVLMDNLQQAVDRGKKISENLKNKH